MKKRLSLKVFAILMAALLVSVGSAWATPAQDDIPGAGINKISGAVRMAVQDRPIDNPVGSPDEKWSQTFGGTRFEEAYSVQQTRDGGFIVAGTTSSFGAGLSDFWLVKTDERGNELWNRTFGGPLADIAYSVQQTREGGLIVAGMTHSFGAGMSDFWLVKTDEWGNKLWNRTFGGLAKDTAHSVQQTRDGGFILAGYTRSFGAGADDFWLVKTDGRGNELWNRTFGGPLVDIAHSVQQAEDGGFIVAGYTRSFGAGADDFWLVKMDEWGNELWNRTFGGPREDIAYSVQQTEDGDFIVAGVTQSFGAGLSDFWLVKTDGRGNELWNRTFGGPIVDIAHSVKQTEDGGFIVAGHTNSFDAGLSDFWLVRTDERGNELWNRTLGGPLVDIAYSVQQTEDGSFIVAGHTTSFGARMSDFWLVLARVAVVVFRDSSLDAVMRAAMGIGPDVNIDRAEVERLTTLVAIGRGISDLTGLEYAVNLTRLYLVDNQITDISPLVQNYGLSGGDLIDLRGNPLSRRCYGTLIPQLERRGVTVVYVLPRYSLTVAADPPESGKISLSPGPDPDGTYLRWTEVTLTAEPAAGWQFEGWSGDAEGTEPTITLTIDPHKSVTAHFADVLPPEVISVTPGDGATDVVRDTDISVTFSEAMNRAAVEEAFSIEPDVPGALIIGDETLAFNPDADLAYGTTYTIIISTDASDLAGNVFDAPYTWTFTTEAAPFPLVMVLLIVTGLTILLAIGVLLYFLVLRKKKEQRPYYIRPSRR
jgi:uncharacterized repeat protein (TIGR02543 family)